MIKVVHNFLVDVAKPHICDGCVREFPKKTAMECCKLYDTIDKKWDRAYLCPTCQIVIRHFMPDGGEYFVGDFKDKALHYEETGELE